MRFKNYKSICLIIIAVLFLGSCKNYKGPSLFKGDTFTHLQYYGKNYCLSSSGGCNSWELYIQDDHKYSQFYHLRPGDKNRDHKACATDCTWKYDRESGVLTITATEYNSNYEASISSKLSGDFVWENGEFGERFYSKSNPDVSIYME